MFQLNNLIRQVYLPASGKLMLLAAVIGLVSGIGAIVFQFFVQLVQHLVLLMDAGVEAGEALAEYSPFPDLETHLSPFRLLLILTVGGLLAGWLAWYFAPEASGHGTDAAIDAF